MQGYTFDLEADNLYLQSTKIWIIVLKSLDGSLGIADVFRLDPETWEVVLDLEESAGF